MKPLAIYIHWPFCLSKCPYCDFASRPLPSGQDEAEWAVAYAQELDFYAPRLGPRIVTSVYFGGGTPSLMKPETVGAVLGKIAALWPLAPTCEVTLEANPSSSEEGKFQEFRAAGVNRLSLGVQSFNDDALRFLGRAHDAKTARRAIEAAARTFDRFSFDLIYAYAGQTKEQWEAELAEAFSLNPKHLSLYQLTIGEGSVFYKRASREKLTLPTEEAADFFEETQEAAARAGLTMYEISNYAQKGQESRHNLTYWRYEEYLGVGPSAHGRFVDSQGRRWATENAIHPLIWLAQRATARREEELDQETAMREALLMGLRLAEGVSYSRWAEKFSCPLNSFLAPHRLEVLQKEGLMERTEEALRPTREGLQKADAVAAFLLEKEQDSRLDRNVE